MIEQIICTFDIRGKQNFEPSAQKVLESRTFGIDVNRVKEFIPQVKIFAIPNAPALCLGVINLRGEILPVFLLDGDEYYKQISSGPKVVILKVHDQKIGLKVDKFGEVITLDQSAKDSFLLELQIPEVKGRIICKNDSIINILDPDKLVKSRGSI